MQCEILNCASHALPGESLCTYHLRHYVSLRSAGVPDKHIKQQLDQDMKKVNSCHNAANLLQNALTHLQDRAVTYDNSQGERSMSKTVAMFNALTDQNLTEEQGWKFMALLKLVRSEQGEFKADSYEDGAAYFALAGETASSN